MNEKKPLKIWLPSKKFERNISVLGLMGLSFL